MAASLSSSRPEIHGHRGCRGLRPENTLPAFLHALALGVDVLELDVVVSADREVVVSHEPWLSAAICLDPQGQPISPTHERQHNLYQLPYATIRTCDCGSRPHPAFSEQQPVAGACKPLLRELLPVLDAAAARLGRPAPGYSVEIKSSPAGDNYHHPTPDPYLDLVLPVLAQAGVLARTTLLCFDVRILQAAHLRLPELATCLLLEDARPWSQAIRTLGFRPHTFGPNFESVTPAAVQELRASFPGVRLVPWTVNLPADFLRLAALGVDGITTDYPNRALAVLAG